MYTNKDIWIFFVCLEFIVPLEIFSLIWRRHHCRWRAAHFDLCSALMAIEQWGFFNVPHLLRHGASVCNGHLRGPVTLTPVYERFCSGDVTNCFYDLGLSQPGIEPRSPACKANDLHVRTFTPPRRLDIRKHKWKYVYYCFPFFNILVFDRIFSPAARINQLKNSHPFFTLVEYLKHS